MNHFHPKHLIIAIAACMLGVVLALVGAELPAGTSFIAALPFWLTIACTAALLLTVLSKLIGDLAHGAGMTSFAAASLTYVAAVLLATLPIALMCLPIDTLLPESDGLFEASATTNPVSGLLVAWVDQYLNLLPAIAGFSLFIKALDIAFPPSNDAPIRDSDAPHMDHHQTTETSGPGSAAQGRNPSPLARRFPEIAGQTLFAIEADEHYVRLHTDAGSKHVLYRFRDALKDVEELPGLRVHRSWWVAEEAMDGLEPAGSGASLRLQGGLSAPVSQTYRREVERVIEARSNSG
ncbi:MAG: LytTR family DNA-binding domain-containing protein [Geminicoccaceae bacterium]